MSVTFVSAFVDLNRVEPRPQEKSLRQYLTEGRKLLASGVPLVLFVERRCIELMFEDGAPPSHVVVVPFEFEQLWLWSWMAGRTDLRLPATRYIEKDTLAYMALQHQKTDWLRQATESNPFGTDSFVWLDFGASWMMESPLADQHRELQRIARCSIDPDKVIAPGLEPPSVYAERYSQGELIDYPHFAFLGTLLAAGHRAARRLDALHKRLAIQLFAETKVVTWEVIVWLLLERQCPELFDHYVADHDDSLLTAFPTDGVGAAT